MANPIRILFLCTGNSCRSQMAEGWAKHLKGNVIEPFSAGLIPTPVNARAIEVMKETGVDISDHYAKHIKDLAGIDFDYVITLCDNAKQLCPKLPDKTKTIHRNFPDPSFLIGTSDEIMAAFRRVRDQIRAFVETLPESLKT